MSPDEIDPSIWDRVEQLEPIFNARFGSEAEFAVSSPGRAEIIGNHTDYNGGHALACALASSIIALFRKRTDSEVHIISGMFPHEPLRLRLADLRPGEKRWGRYAQAVIAELQKLKPDISGAEVLIESTIPTGAGVSSSAAFEIALALGFQKLSGIEMSALETALLCQAAENGPFVGSPCGLLDQASILLAEKDRFLLFDFNPEHPRLSARTVTSDMSRHNLRFVIAVDPVVRRTLGDSAYVTRRQECEAALLHLRAIAQRDLASLCALTPEAFAGLAQELERRGSATLRKRAQHVIEENARVLKAVTALECRHYKVFGQLLTRSGESAIRLFDVAQATPQLNFLFEAGHRLPGVLGTRNMGGGFSAITLSLVDADFHTQFTNDLQDQYRSEFGRSLTFDSFMPSHHAAVL